MDTPRVHLHTQQLPRRTTAGWLNVICTTNVQESHYVEKGGELEEISRICDNSQGSEVLVSTSVYSPPQPSWCRLQLGPGLYPTCKANKCILGHCCQCLLQAQPARPPGHHHCHAPGTTLPLTSSSPGQLDCQGASGVGVPQETVTHASPVSSQPDCQGHLSQSAYTEVTPVQGHTFKFKRGSSFI